LEQLVIEDVLGDLEERDLGIGMWILPTILQHGTPEQIEAWVGPSLQGVLRWCQLFSEPDAGSDAAAVRTRGTRVEGGWRVTGQKIWTSDAQHCTLGLATVRTDPEAPKHRGITAMVVDLAAAGVEVRPLRDMTGAEIFNEVFLDDVLVPDDHVIGAPGEGWTVARSTLSNERLTIGRGVRMPGLRAADVLERVEDGSRDPVLLADAGRLLAREEALTLLNEQLVALALSGGDIGARGSLSKLVGAELAQQVADLVRVVTGVELVSGRAQALAREVLFTRCLTIAGGTSEITRNQIGERLLGLPRDPLLT
jgi:alkylation response protein AidB-like acyl-CoA dehydrogenase